MAVKLAKGVRRFNSQTEEWEPVYYQVTSWEETLYEIWLESRELPNWGELYEMHDMEDKKYFDMLDEGKSNGK